MYPTDTEEQVRYWQNQITYAQQKAKPLFAACDILQKQYFGQPSTDREATTGEYLDEEHIRRTKSGLIFGWIDQSVSNMVDRNPVFKMFPQNKQAAERLDPEDGNSLSYTQAAEKVINYRYRETGQLRVDERCAIDSFVFPYSVAKLGYTIDDEKVEQQILLDSEDAMDGFEDPEEENSFLMVGESVKVHEEDDHKLHIESHEERREELRVGLKKRDFKETVVSLDNHIAWHNKFYDRPAPAANQRVRRGAPYGVRWRPDLFLTDTFCVEGPTDARWIAFGWELPLDEVQASPHYKNTDKIKATRFKDAPERVEGDEADDGFDVVRGWEIWAKNFPVGKGKFRDLLLTIVEDGEDFFIQEEEEWPYDRIDDYPVEVLTFHQGLDSWYHLPTLLMGGGDTVQALVDEILDSFLGIVRKQKNVWLVDPKLGLNKTVIADMLAAPDGSVIEVPGLAEKGAANAILALPFHQIPSDKEAMLSVLQQNFDRSVGTPQPQQLPATNTATEASISEKRNSSRENRRSGLLSEFQTRKARKMFQMDLQYQPDQLFLIDEATSLFANISKEMSMGEYMTTMDVTSHTNALSIERSQYADLLNLFAGLTPIFIENFGLPPNLPELARRLLVKGWNEATVDEILPMLSSASEMLKQKAVQMGQAGGQAGTPIVGADGVQTQPGAQANFATEEGQAANDAVIAGQGVGVGINALDPGSFNRDAPNEGRQSGNAETA